MSTGKSSVQSKLPPVKRGSSRHYLSIARLAWRFCRHRRDEGLAGSSEFVFSDAMSNMLEQLRQHFDYVIINSPPLVPLVDARALAEIADRVVLTIRWDSTPQDVVAQALGTLASSYDRVLGTVLTRVDMQRLRFYDYYQSSAYLTPYSYLGQPRAERTS